MSGTHKTLQFSTASLEQQRGWIYGWAFRLLQNHDDALDATQNVLLKTIAQPTGTGQQTRSRSWLRRVTVNHCVDLIRQRRRRWLTDGSAGEEAAGAEAIGDITPIAALERVERGRAVTAALQQLSEAQRAVVIAKTFDGDTFETIAREMGVSPSTVKTHYVRGLRRMRELLSAADAEEQP